MKKLVLIVTIISAFALTACGNSTVNGNVTNTVASNSITDAAEEVKEIIEEAESSVIDENDVTDNTDADTEPVVEESVVEEPVVHECKNAEPLSPDAVVDYSATYIDGTRYEIGDSIGWVYLNDEQMIDCEDLIIGNEDAGITLKLSELLKESELDKTAFTKNEYGYYECNYEKTSCSLIYEDDTLRYLLVDGYGEHVINNTKYSYLNDLIEEFGKPYILRYNSLGYVDADYFSPEYGESYKHYAYAFRFGDYIVSYRVEYASNDVDDISLFGCTIFNINAYEDISDIAKKM